MCNIFHHRLPDVIQIGLVTSYATHRQHVSKGARPVVRSGDGQTLDRRRGDMCGHAQADQVVDDEAVEDAAEEVLRVLVKRRAQAEDGVRRHTARGQNRRDERELVRGGRDIAIRQPRTLETIRFQQPPCVGDGR